MGLEPYITEDNFVFDKEKGFYCFQKTGANNPSCLGDGKGRFQKLKIFSELKFKDVPEPAVDLNFQQN